MRDIPDEPETNEALAGLLLRVTPFVYILLPSFEVFPTG